jgi:uncharacterized protein (DUF488 family)
MLTLYTVGHSTHSIDHFIGLLEKHQIQAIGDVRSSPFSRFNPQFNQDTLSRALKAHGISYVFLGNELGARRKESECYVGNKVSYELVAKTKLFQDGLARLRVGAAKMRVAIMCAEKDPITCHRTVLVAKEAKNDFGQILHIRETGIIEDHTQAEERLLAAYRVNESDMFVSREERLKDAYRRRAEEIAFEEQEPTQEKNHE